ncbi:MAG: aminotransferase class I/II-fold pyridoxal phosphate-dependent enzyme [Leptospira sp.]|nr:aminotransferase class I/II-fold pyridoxal phosphate-dependent enzyme [Leptospira sp.]
MELREFFIEDRLEKYRLEAECNLGESGIRNFSLGELLRKINLSPKDLESISLADSANQGSIGLRREIASLYGNSISEENVLVTTGTSEALFLFFQIFVKKQARISLFTPAFQALYEVPQSVGAIIYPVDVVESQLDIDALWTHDPDLVIINHPHNPTGKSLSDSDWNRLEENIENHKAIVLFDEHYRFLDFHEDLTPTGADLGKNCFATGSITKCFGVVGLKIGWIVGEKSFIDKARSFKDYLTHTVNPISEFLCEQILIHRKKLIDPIKKSVLSNIEYFQKHLAKIPGVLDFQAPDGGLVGFIKLEPGIMSESYCDDLYKDTSVFLLPGANFEKEGYVRIGFGESEDRFRDGINRWIRWEKYFSR